MIVSGYSGKSAARKLHFQRGPPATRASDADASEFVFLLFLNLYFCFIDDPFRLYRSCAFLRTWRYRNAICLRIVCRTFHGLCVCVCVCVVLGTPVRHARTDEPIEMLFGWQTDVGRRIKGTCRPKGSPYSITERRVPGVILVLCSQLAGDVSHKPGGRLPLLFGRPAVTLAILKRAATNFAAW